MSNLFLRTVSQGLQAFMPIAVSLVWLRNQGDPRWLSAIRRGLVCSVPATLVASWWSQQSVHRALDEAVLATIAVVIAYGFLVLVQRRTEAIGDARAARRLPPVLWAAAVVLIVVRQTMEIGSVLAVAAVQLRSLDATSAVIEGIAVSSGIAWLWTRFARRVPSSDLTSATRVFAAVFLAQVLFYAFHQWAEARLLPWSDSLHAATELYGPDGIYGVHLSDLLIVAPVVTVAWGFARSHVGTGQASAWRMVDRKRFAIGVLIAVCLTLMGMQRTDALPPHPSPGASAAEIAAIDSRPHVLFRNTALGPYFGRLSMSALDALDVRLSTTLSCDRLSFAGGQGICLHTERGVFYTHTAVLLDAHLKARTSIKLLGLPSRTRLSADGRVGAVTVFVTGDGYASSFSTRTTLIDLSSGDEIGELEQFATWRNGERFRAVDFNFWGVTFARDGNSFYASVRSAGITYLVRGELALRKLMVLRDRVECPALSPDNGLLAYKKRVGPGPDTWRLHVLDLATNVERILTGETRYVDDQVEWLDAQHVLYAVPRRTTAISDVWVVPIDGSAPARVFLPEAESPIVVP